ncbi:hypothetical protein SNE40_001258 [Patella caerulea]|uniref:Uncharacterized protein n=1 Tax=Patella caerulea TaxID=87958 RepID=A0AAN8KE70_PATCE
MILSDSKECYVCRSHAEGQYYPHCPMEGNVNPQITWKENCTGHCFTRTDDLDKELVYRGCVDSQWGLPDPLPPDGCYTYYLEVWCVCGTNLCNGVALGKPKGVEFDAHIPKKKKETTDGSSSHFVGIVFVSILSLAAILTINC